MERPPQSRLQAWASPPGWILHTLLLLWTLGVLWRAEFFCLGVFVFGLVWSARLVLWFVSGRPSPRALWRWAGLPILLALQIALVAFRVPYRLWFARNRPELELRVLAARDRLDAGARLAQVDGPLEGYELHSIEGSYAFETIHGDPYSDWTNVGVLWVMSGPPPTPDGDAHLEPLGHGWFYWRAWKSMAFDEAWEQAGAQHER